ncbi:MAG: hypothetical protein K9H58_17915 [Bacteroidales bacterium]|nr:hypothetical protein [Bacteroidales bacterium]
MKTNHLPFILFTSLLLLFYSCETDFKTIADYEDITVVYGLLDQKNQDQFIKINKAYLSEGDILTYAQKADCTNYLIGVLDVSIEEYTPSGNLVRSYPCDTTTIFNKEPGVFYYPEQVLFNWQRPESPYGYEYVIIGFNDTVGVIPVWLNEDNIYKLKIQNTKTGKTITSETNLVNEFEFTSPPPSRFINFINDPIGQKTFSWNEAENAGKYELEMRFYFQEILFNSADTVERYITLAKTSASAASGSSGLSFYYKDENFYTSCLNLIPYSDTEKEDNVRRRLSGNIEFTVAVAEEDYALFMQVNEPSTSIVQEKPQYSNIENGIGIFSSRYNKKLIKDLHTQSVSLLIQFENLKFIL